MRLDTLKKELKEALSKATDKAAKAFFERHLEALDAAGLDGAAAQADIDRILKDVKKTFGRTLEALADAPYATAYSEAYGLGAREIAEDFSVKDTDQRALDTLRDYSTWWIRDNMSQDVINTLKDNLSQAITNGWTRAQLASSMKKALKGFAQESELYWEITADHMLSKVQSLGHVAGYTAAQIEQVKVVAVLDGRTTPICRHMHGRIIQVTVLQKQYDDIIEASKVRDLKEAKAAAAKAQPLISKERFGKVAGTQSTDDIIKQHGIALPPYHWRCRTVTIAYFVSSNMPQYTNQYGTNAPRKILTSLTDAEIYEWVTELRRKAKGGDLPYSDKDRIDDRKHWAEMGAKTQEEYENICRKIVKDGKQIGLRYYRKGHEIQTQFSDGKRIVVCDKWSMKCAYAPSEAARDHAINNPARRIK